MNCSVQRMIMEPLAKPSGITYTDHRQHVVEQAAMLLQAWPFLSKKYLASTGRDLTRDLEQAAYWHDAGKQHPDWQVPCQKDYDIYHKWRIANGLVPDRVNTADYRQFEEEQRRAGRMAGKHLFTAGLRHEFASLQAMKKSGLTFDPIVEVSIAAHHGKLSFLHEKRWRRDGAKNELEPGPYLTYFEKIRGLQTKLSTLGSLKKIVQDRFKFGAVRTLLQLADTRASRMESNGPASLVSLHPFELKDRFSKLRPVQQAALDLADQTIAILRAPTGSGKTYAALLWAEHQVKTNKADRLVIAMPTRFTSNALALSASKQMGAVGLYHSSAWYQQFADLSPNEQYQAKEIHRMARFLATPVNVCTIDHLLIALTGTKEHHHHTFYFLANSAVVFDEADFYDPFVQANLVILLEVLRTLKVPVLIMSATVPDSARQLYHVELPIQAAPAEEKHAVVNKEIRWSGKVERPEMGRSPIAQMLEAGHGIIYANTVARALQFYDYLEQSCEEKRIPLILYHSRFTEPDKKRIEEELLDILGEKAWSQGAKQGVSVRGIAILTQIGEMSVNISAPIMLSDVCPWDRLSQRIGRLVRFAEARLGVCYVMQPIKAEAFYPAPYGEYDKARKRWQAFPAMMETTNQIERMQSVIVSADFLVDRVNELYATLPKLSNSAATNQRDFVDLIKNNWIILPNTRVEEDDGEAGRWSSRKIPPQVLIFINVEVVPPHFKNYNEYQELALQYACTCPLYLVEKELRKPSDLQQIGRLPKAIGQKEDVIQIFYLKYQELYHPKKGLAFLYEY